MAKAYQNNSLESIEKLLKDSFIDRSNLLIEKSKGSNGKPFIMERKLIPHAGIDFLLTRFDPNKISLFPYFSETSGLKQICDYLLFVVENNRFYIFLIELKFGTESPKKQLDSTAVFAKFLIDSGIRVGLEFPSEYDIIKVRVSEERAKKRNKGSKIGSLKFDINNIINYDHSDVFRIKEVLDAFYRSL